MAYVTKPTRVTHTNKNKLVLGNFLIVDLLKYFLLIKAPTKKLKFIAFLMWRCFYVDTNCISPGAFLLHQKKIRLQTVLPPSLNWI
jgi:hypothetical protein